MFLLKSTVKAAAALAFAVGIACGAHAARTVCVSEQTDSAVTLAFGGVDELDYELFLAHGATDGGDDKAKWDSFEKIADIACDQTSFTYEVPAALRDGRPMRFFLMQTVGVHMAREFSSITSTGAQWISTGTAATNIWIMDFRFKTGAIANDKTFFGQKWGGGQYLFILQNDSGTKFRFYGSSPQTVSGITPAANTDYRLVIDPSSYLTITGGGSEARKSISRQGSVGNSFAIFSDYAGEHAGAYTFYRMKIASSYTPLFDFVPAANAAGDVGLYDQVHDVFYPNQTATPFQTGDELPQGRFGRVMDETPTFRFRPAISVDSATADAVTLSFANLGAEPHKLYVAYGATDCEERKDAWDNFAEVATIATDATSYVYTLPAALKADGVYFRFFLAKTGELPYAAELASITSTGAQMVRLDYVPGTDTTTDFRIGDVTYEHQKVFFGQHWGSNAYLFNMQSSTFRFHGGGATFSGIAPASGTDYRCRIAAGDKSSLEGGGALAAVSENLTAYPFIDLCVFADHRAVTYNAKFRFDSMRVKDGGIVVRDLVPVRTAAGKGALFDRANGVVYENVTTTDFTLGEASARPAWVVSVSPRLVGSSSGAPAGAGLPQYVALSADTAWADLKDGIAEGGTVNLNGHALHVADCADFVSRNVSVMGDSGTFRVTVPANATSVLSSGAAFSAKAHLVKDGPGTLVLSRVLSSLTGVTVAEGIVQYGTPSVFANNGMTVEVKDGAALDVAGRNGNAVRYKIAGTGPDGNGALRNTGGDVANNVSQMYGLELTADATVTGGSQGLIAPNYPATTLALNGHTLTLNLNAGKSFWICNTSSSEPGTVHVKSGVAHFHRNAVNLPNVDFVIDGAQAIFRQPGSSQANPTVVKSVTLTNGGSSEEGQNCTKMQDLNILGSGTVGLQSHVKWVYVADTVLVSNETGNVFIYPPLNANGTYPKIVKKGAGTFTIANNYTDQRIDRGVEIFGGTVVMSSSRTSGMAEHKAISSQPVPVTIHAGGTLDMTQCTNGAFAVSSLTIEDGGTLLHTAKNTLSFARPFTYAGACPFSFSGTVNFTTNITFDVSALYAGASAPAAGTDVTLVSAGAITRTATGALAVTGCPYGSYVTFESGTVTLHTVPPAVAELNPIKIWNVGGTLVYGANGNCYRSSLGALLAQEGWNVQMTGWRTANASKLCTATEAWKRNAGVASLALKTSATRAGLLEGLETYCAAAGEPDFTVFLCGDTDVADGVADATVFANYTNAVTRIKAALPMTTVLACTIPGASAALNEDIAAWCGTEADVEAVDVAGLITSSQTQAQCDAVAAAIKAKLTTLATANGKNNPSSWTRPTVTLGAENNVPAAYRAGFTRVRSIEPTATLGYAQNIRAIPYAYAPAMRETGITKVAYYVELVRADTGALQALWVDMDAPGPTWADVCLPVTLAQQKQQTVTKLHVWSNFGGVQTVAADDDTVEGRIEFNPINYGKTDVAGANIAEPWSNCFGFSDTFNTSGSSGHGCFQLMRKFSDPDAFPAGEILFAYNRWGSTTANNRAIGMGTLANYGNHGYTTDRELDWTRVYDGDAGNISANAYSFMRIDFWVQYNDDPATRADLADYAWAGASGAAFATPGNWAKDNTAATSLANATLILPENASPSFTYVGYDPVSLATTTFMVDGTATFPEVGGFYLSTLDLGATGKLVYDPTKFTFRLVAPPTFASGAKIALAPKYAANTKGRFLLMTWDHGALDMDAAALNAIFDASSAQGTDVKVWAENLEAGGGRLWLDLDYAAPKQRINILCTGDSITQGSDTSYGNWRTGLMKKLAAAGYAPVAKGHWNVHSADICGAVMPDEWVWHSGISGQRLVTKNGGGTIDAIETMLDCAGDVDFILAKICTNDINGNGSTAEELFPVWTNLVWKALNQKPHVKFIAGAVVDIAYSEAKNAQVVAFNAAISNAIASAMFPAKRTYFADLYTPCYRYDAGGNYIVGSFLSETNLHPDWPGEDKMADVYCAAILGAIADDPGFELGAQETVTETTSGCENNVPAEYLAGMTRARVFDIAANGGTSLATLGHVPYSVVNDAAPTANISRVGYYIELKRRDTALDAYHGLTRWIWVSMDAFGGCTLDDVGIPLTTVNQCVVNRLRVKTNMPGVESTSADANDVRGWVEFWPSTYDIAACGLADAPADTFRCDWNDVRKDNMSGYGSMQVHRFTPGAANPAMVMFAFNRWTTTACYEIGIGNFSHQGKSVDWTWMGDANTRERMSSLAYEVARIEIWTAADVPADAAFVRVDGVASEGGGEATVNGEVVSFGEGADSAAVTLEWSTDPAFATVAGSTNLGVVAETGAVTATATGLTAGETWYFRFTSVNSENVSAAGGVSDPLDYSEGVWRPQTAGDAWTSVAWLKNGAGSPVAFNPAWSALFDGQEATKVASVQVPERVVAEQVMVDAAEDYTLGGAGSIASKRLVKRGTGTLTLEAGVLAATPNIDVEGGTVKIGDDAVAGAAGMDNGTITVKDGAQFDVNYTDTTGGSDRPRALITNKKKFVIEGDGPDGQGALISSSSATAWNNALSGGVELTGDASIGGQGRLEIRSNAVTGPTNVALTVKMNNGYGFGVNSAISVGKVVVPENCRLKFESSALKINVPHGFDLSGIMKFYNANPTWNASGINVYGSSAQIGNDNGTSYVKTPLNVSAGATLTLVGSATTVYSNGVVNAGTINRTGGTHNLYGDAVNVGNPLLRTNGNIYWYPSTVTGDSRAEVTGGQLWLSGRSDWGDAALAVALSGGGSLVVGANNDGYGMPKFGKNKLSVTVASGHTGTLYLHSAASGSIDGMTVSGPLANFCSQGQNVKSKHGGPIVDLHVNDLVVSANSFQVGTVNGRGELTVTGENSHIAAKGLYANWVSTNYYAGALTFSDGLLEVGSNGISEEWIDPMRTVFNMESGTLRATDSFYIGKAGMTASFGSPKKGGRVTFDLNGKTVTWGTGLNGASDVTLTGAGSFAPDRPGIQGIPTGKWTVNATGGVDLRNAAGFAGGLSLGENAAATLDIAGTSLVEFVAWTWHDNAWNIMRPRFAADEPMSSHVATSLTYFNRAASQIRDRKDGNGSGFNYFGEFFVSEAQAGTWTFHHYAKTHFGIMIDDTEISKPGANIDTTVTKALTAGWHKFMVSVYTSGANAQIGPYSGADAIEFKAPGDTDYTVFDSTTVPMRMRQHLGARTSVRWRKYAHPGNNLGVYATCDESKFAARDTITNTLAALHASYATGVNAPNGGGVGRFDGYFKVDKENAGQWTFTGKYGNQIALDVDGRRLFAATANDAQVSARMTLSEGWHKFDVRVGNNATNTTDVSGGKLTDADGNVCSLMFRVGDGVNHSFDERYLPIAYTTGVAQKFEKPGLCGEIELAAGSSLTNAPQEGGWCPIYGTLKGTGTLSGPFRFTGEDNCWEVTGASRDISLNAVTFADADANALAGLKKLEVTFDAKPKKGLYELSDALGLTAETVGDVALTVTDAAGNDYADIISLTVEDGKLRLANPSAVRTMIIIR